MTTLEITFTQGRAILDGLCATLTPMNRDRMEHMGSVGRGYAWGREDSPEYRRPEHGGDALDFGVAYMIHVGTGSGGFLGVRRAFEQWYATGRITR